MNWFKKLFRRKPDPLAAFRQPIPVEVMIEERAALHEERVRDLVTQGFAEISPYSNVAPGTYGAALMDAVQRGYMRQVQPSRFNYATGG